jgi:hypothetical protein|tara:strand:+ start:443 stop:712 length:270 start_codon:yes stop_codon:yes gene_type:complete
MIEDNKCVYIDFVINFIDAGMQKISNVERIDACCQLSAEIGATGLVYGDDFWFHEAFAATDEYILKFGFKDKHEAMIIKLSGITPHTIH